MAERPKEASPPKQEHLFMLVHLVFVAAAAVLVFSFVNVAREGESRRQCSATCILHPDYAGADRKAPDFKLTGMNGESVSLSSYRGKVVVLNFWTKTCGPCLEEMPEIADLTRILSSRSDVAVLAVSTDEGPAAVKDTLKGILRDETPPFTVLFDPEADVVMGKYGTHLFPETWIIDQRGVIRARFDGQRKWSDSSVVEMVDMLRSGGFCKIEVKEGQPITAEGKRICESITGG
jgi:peroxiredoxin